MGCSVYMSSVKQLQAHSFGPGTTSRIQYTFMRHKLHSVPVANKTSCSLCVKTGYRKCALNGPYRYDVHSCAVTEKSNVLGK